MLKCKSFRSASALTLAVVLAGALSPNAFAQEAEGGDGTEGGDGNGSGSSVCQAAGLPLLQTVRLDALIETVSGDPLDAVSERPFLSGDGGSVIFESEASNIRAFLRNGQLASLDGQTRQVFVLDLRTRRVNLVSVNTRTGEPSNGDCTVNEGGLNFAGDIAVFECSGDNLVPNDTNEVDDIFAHFLKSNIGYGRGTTVRVSRGFSSNFKKGDLSGPDSVVSDDVSALGIASGVASIAPFEPVVVFSSAASNLLEEPLPPVTAGLPSIQNYTYDLNTGEMAIVSKDNDGLPADPIMLTPAISGDGRIVASPSPARNLIDCNDDNGVPQQDCLFANQEGITNIFRFENMMAKQVSQAFLPGTKMPIPQEKVGSLCSPAFEEQFGFTNPACGSLSPDLSYTGRYLVFDSTVSNFDDPTSIDLNETVDVYVYDAETHRIKLVSRAPGTDQAPSDFEGIDGLSAVSDAPEVSGNGQYVIYRSSARELTQGASGWGFFLADLNDLSSPAQLVSVPPVGESPFFFSQSAGQIANNDMPNLSANGEIAAFSLALAEDDPAEGEDPTLAPEVPGFLRCLRID